MALRFSTRSVVALATVAVLSSCSSDDNDSSQVLDAAPIDNMEGTPAPGSVTDDGNDNGQDPDMPEVDLATTPVFNTTTCDAAPAPEDTASSSVAAAPARIMPNTLVSGRLSPESTSNSAHYWSVDLEAGIYHLILESRTSSGAPTNIGLLLESTDAAGDPLERLIRSNEVDHRIRALRTLTLQSAETLRLKVSPVFNQEDYLLGIFTNGTPIASPMFPDSTPTFTGCPEISTLPIDTTQPFLLESGGNSGVNERWFQSTLETANYTLFAMTAVEDGTRTNILLTARSYNQLGQIDQEETVIRTNEIDTMFNTSGSLQPVDAGLYWIRFRNRNSRSALNVSATLSLN